MWNQLHAFKIILNEFVLSRDIVPSMSKIILKACNYIDGRNWYKSQISAASKKF